MEGKELFEEGKSRFSRALENTQFTHIHSEDIRINILNDYYIPAAKQGYVPAILEVYDYYESHNDYNECIYWVKQYKKITGCSKKDLVKIFGIKIITHILF